MYSFEVCFFYVPCSDVPCFEMPGASFIDPAYDVIAGDNSSKA